jgi:uncharacterized protein YqgV (UPF0045/DUF77 family)
MIRAEFTIYPFIEGMAPPPYVQVAIDALRAAGLSVEVGPLSNTVFGDDELVLDALRAAQAAAVAAGATRVVLSLETRT